METVHEPVLLNEVLEMMALHEGNSPLLVFDATLGGGGHAEAILRESDAVRLFGCDRDPRALERVRSRLAPYAARSFFVHGNFCDLEHHLASIPSEIVSEERGEPLVDRILIDLGISSDQLDDPSRGFSFRSDGPLDMRMNPEQGESAADLLNERSQQELERIFIRGGVSAPLHRRLAKEIIATRPILSTFQFANLCRKVTPVKYGKEKSKDAAMVPFQALRIAVNGEFDAIDQVLPQALRALKAGGRLLVISFHSLEDKAVAHTMRAWTRVGELPPGVPVRGSNAGLGTLLTPQAIVPSEDEVRKNPRSRSARMRVFQKSAADVEGWIL